MSLLNKPVDKSGVGPLVIGVWQLFYNIYAFVV